MTSNLLSIVLNLSSSTYNVKNVIQKGATNTNRLRNTIYVCFSAILESTSVLDQTVIIQCFTLKGYIQIGS
jgi:hypothetical protein